MNRIQKLLVLSLVFIYPASGALANSVKQENWAPRVWASNSIKKIGECADKTVKKTVEYIKGHKAATGVGVVSAAAITVLFLKKLPYLLAPSKPKEALNYYIDLDDPSEVRRVLASHQFAGYEKTAALNDAVSHGKLACVKALIAAGADPNSSYVNTPLFCAVYSHQLECLKELVASGANPNAGLKPAINYGDLRGVEALLAAGADPNFGQGTRFSPIYEVVHSSRMTYKGKIQCIGMLVAHGTVVTESDRALIQQNLPRQTIFS